MDLFDGPFFRMSRAEAAALDPQTRLLLQVTQEALSDAGECRGSLAACNSATGERHALAVFIAQHTASPASLPCAAGSAYNASALAPATGTYVGCMLGDYMNLLRVALQQKHTGPVMTGGHRQRCMRRRGDAAASMLMPLPTLVMPQISHPPDSPTALQAMARRTRAGVWPTHSACRAPAMASTPPAPPPWWLHTMPTEVSWQHAASWPASGFPEHDGVPGSISHCMAPLCAPAGILGGEAVAAVAAGINVMVWHETTVGICQLQASSCMHGCLALRMQVACSRLPSAASAGT